MVELNFDTQSAGFVGQAFDDGLRILRLRKYALVLLGHKFNAFLFKPLICLSIVELIEETLHELVASGIDVSQVTDVRKTVGQIAAAAARNAYLSKHLAGLFIYRDRRARAVLLCGYGGEEACRATAYHCDMV